MRKLLLLSFLIFLLGKTARASTPLTASDTGLCTTAGACLVVAVPLNTASAALQLSGTFSATLQFEGCVDNCAVAASWFAVQAFPLNSSTAVTSATGIGAWRVTTSGLNNLRIRCSTYSSGTVNASISLSLGGSANGLGGSSSGGTVTSVSGTPNQIDVATGTTTPVVSLDPAIILPGSLTVPTGSSIAVSGTGTNNATLVNTNTFPAAAGFTSGGVACYTSTSVQGSSALLTSNVLPKGGGSGACPSNSLATDNGTTLTYTGTGGVSAQVLTSSVAIGTAPLTVTSTTVVPNLNVSLLGGATFAAPGAIGGTTPSSGAFTSLSSTGILSNSQAGALSAAAVNITGAPVTGGSGTTTFPLFYINDGTGPTTFSTSGTELGINAPSGFAGNIFDSHVNGGISLVTISSSGRLSWTALANISSGHIIESGTAPTIGTCGTSPNISIQSGTAAFSVNVGTGGTASTCSVTLPAATNDWNCQGTDSTTTSASVFITKQSVWSSTGATFTNYTDTGSTGAWASGDVLKITCTAE